MGWLKSLILAMLVVFSPIKFAMIAVAVLVLADFILGIVAAHKRGESITSAGFRRTIVKVFVYEAALALGFIAEKYLMAGVLPLSNIISGFIGLTEIKSITENLNEISGNNLLKALLTKLGSTNDEPKQ